MRNRLRSLWLFARLPFFRKRLLAEAVWFLIRVRPLTKGDISAWKALAGEYNTETDEEITPEIRTKARQVGWAVVIASRNLPGEFACLPQALAAQIMLKRRGIPATLYLGAAFKPTKDALKAHAWTRAGNVIVTGAPQHLEYRVVASFSPTLKSDLP